MEQRAGAQRFARLDVPDAEGASIGDSFVLDDADGDSGNSPVLHESCHEGLELVAERIATLLDDRLSEPGGEGEDAGDQHRIEQETRSTSSWIMDQWNELVRGAWTQSPRRWKSSLSCPLISQNRSPDSNSSVTRGSSSSLKRRSPWCMRR